MIKLVTMLKRGAGLTRPQFEDRWLRVHAPIAAQFPGLRGYVLSFSVENGEPGADGVAQLWFDDRASAQRSYASETGRNGSQDASRHLSRRDHLLVSEVWLGTPPDGAAQVFKLMYGIKRRAGQDRAAFIDSMRSLPADRLREALGSGIARLCVDEAGQQLNSGTDGRLELFDAEAAFDAMLEAWYPDARGLNEAAERFAGGDVASHLAQMSDRRELFLLEENVIVAPPEIVQPRSLLSGMECK